jgi:L-lactate dehydrogenase complex protein LldG
MTDSRHAILDMLKASEGARNRPEKPLRPAFAEKADSLAKLLKLKLEAVHTSVDMVDSTEQIGASIVNFLQSNHCSLRVAVTSLTDVNEFSLDQGLEFYTCEELASCKTILSRASMGIAETGTVVLASSVQQPTLASFLPDYSIVILDEKDIVPYMEDALLRTQKSDRGMPRALNLISGPSKTADIEQTLVYGAHGPIQLHVIIRKKSD